MPLSVLPRSSVPSIDSEVVAQDRRIRLPVEVFLVLVLAMRFQA